MISHASDATAASGVTVLGPMRTGYGAILNPGALDFVAALTRRFRQPVHDLLVRRYLRSEGALDVFAVHISVEPALVEVSAVLGVS